MTSRDGSERIQPPPRTLEEALERARRHGLAALAESVSAARALVDAAALAATGAPSDTHDWLARATAWLDGVAEQARSGAGRPLGPWLDAVSDALDDEIERWEEKSRVDPEARAVLRAFLGVREILWEFGLRARDGADDPRVTPQVGTARARAPRTSRPGSPRLQRVPVEG
jgi:hypothetical protein